MEQYRVIREDVVVNQPGEEMPKPEDVITTYQVQVRGFFFWHTVKAFRKICPAVRLLHYLRGLRDD